MCGLDKGAQLLIIGIGDERLFGQHKAEEIAALTRNTLKRMKDIPFVLAPDCSLATNTYDEELRAFIEATHSND